MSPLSGIQLWLSVFFLSSCVVLAEDILNTPVVDDASVCKENTCAITQVLTAMNELLTMLSTEVRGLKRQVRKNCKAKDNNNRRNKKNKDNDVGDTDKDSFQDEEEDVWDDTTLFPDDNATEENEIPLFNPWSIFEREPDNLTTATEVSWPSLFPDFDAEDDSDYGDDKDDTPKTITTSTPEPPRSNTIPPEPISCTAPFLLKAGGCYLFFRDRHDWKSWGNAHAFCQTYGGSLATPLRLQQLQEFLNQHYSDAFWIGANYEATSGFWEWMSGRRVENEAWKRANPVRNPSKKCVFLDKWSGYRASNTFCGEKFPFICDNRQA